VLLPVFSDLIAVLLPILSLLAPVARPLLTETAFAAGKPILEVSTALFGRPCGELTGPRSIAQARQCTLAVANAVRKASTRDGAGTGGRQV
jgi:hypothetical protein